MSLLERLKRCWRNVGEMPFIMRQLCAGGMVAAPLCTLILLPLSDSIELNGRPVSYAQFWWSGSAVALGSTLVLIAVGSWGLAARHRASRWLLVIAPIVPYLILLGRQSIAEHVEAVDAVGAEVVAEALATSVLLYLALFHLRAVRRYLDGVGPSTALDSAPD